MKNIVVFPLSRFPVKLICCIGLESVSNACFYLNLSVSSYNIFSNNYNPADNQLCNHLLG